MGVAFDRFGDFEGFLLLTEEGEEFSFLAREQAIEDRVREAWRDRMVVSVFVELPEVPSSPGFNSLPPGSAAPGSAATLTPGRCGRREPRGART